MNSIEREVLICNVRFIEKRLKSLSSLNQSENDDIRNDIENIQYALDLLTGLTK